MITAEEARKQSQINCDNMLEQELQMIEKEIMAEIASGGFLASINTQISSEATKVLKNLGYKVEDEDNFNFNCNHTYISW